MNKKKHKFTEVDLALIIYEMSSVSLVSKTNWINCPLIFYLTTGSFLVFLFTSCENVKVRVFVADGGHAETK